MKTYIYPFLVASSKKLDFTVVLCPDFLAEKYNLLHKFANNIITDKTFYRLVKFTNEELHLFYQIGIVKDDNNSTLKDDVGRPLYMIYGFITSDNLEKVSDNIFSQIFRDYAKPYYQKFYDSVFFAKPSFSQGIEIVIESDLHNLDIEKQSDLNFDFDISINKKKEEKYKEEDINQSDNSLIKKLYDILYSIYLTIKKIIFD